MNFGKVGDPSIWVLWPCQVNTNFNHHTRVIVLSSLDSTTELNSIQCVICRNTVYVGGYAEYRCCTTSLVFFETVSIFLYIFFGTVSHHLE